MRLVLAIFTFLTLAGCVSTVKGVVTAPFKIVSKTADVLTTSQSESDEKRGRDLRKKEERLGELARKRDKSAKRCSRGNDKACDEVEDFDEAIEKETGSSI